MITERTWLLTLEALDENDNPIVLRFSSGDYTDAMGNYYDLRIKQPAIFTSSAYTGKIIESGSRSAFGETTLINIDGGLDYLADYAVDGRNSVLSLLDEKGIITEVISGTVQSISFESNIISLRLRDIQETLNLSHPESLYLGNNIPPNGLEGTDQDIKGKVKPKCYGKVRNLSAVLVNSQKLIYQAHDDSISPLVNVETVAVYDKGVLLTKHTHYLSMTDFLNATVPAGHYATYEGYFKLGTTPSGTITCDVDSSVFLAGDVFNLLASEAGFVFNQSDRTTINLLGEIGIFLPDSRSTSSMFDQIASSVGGYWYFESNNVRLKQLVTPSDPVNPDLFFYDYQIIDISRTKTGQGKNNLPVNAVSIKADKIETVQNDLAGSVDDAYRARVSQAFREEEVVNPSVKIRHPLSDKLEIESCFRNLSSALVQANRLQTLLGVRRDSVSLKLRLDSEIIPSIQIGTNINLTSYKLGYSLGKNFTVLGYTLDAKLSRVTLELFG